jgi:hypothetical protein
MRIPPLVNDFLIRGWGIAPEIVIRVEARRKRLHLSYSDTCKGQIANGGTSLAEFE